MSQEGKKWKENFMDFIPFFGSFNIFYTYKYVIAGNIYGMFEEKIK